jgi:regulator of cell morphogenesis and NO signaling
MQATQTPTVADIAKGSLAAVRVFERLGIDYCCGGKRPLEDVCRDKGLDATAVQAELAREMAGTPALERDWNTVPLNELIRHIVGTHHDYLKNELPRLSERVSKVARVYAEREPHVTELPGVFEGLRDELEMHLQKEEIILFPAIAALEEADRNGEPPPALMFGTVANPIRMMEHEHDGAGEALAQIRRITREYAIPETACVTFRALMNGLKELEQDLHLHIHLENNILHPRAIALEARMRG